MIACYVIAATALMIGAVGQSVALENVPDVSIGVQQFHQQYQAGGMPRVIGHIRECWKSSAQKKSQAVTSRCFAVDYTANLFDEILAKRSASQRSEFLLIENVLTRVNSALVDLKIDQKGRGRLIADWTNVSEREAIRLAKPSNSAVGGTKDASANELFQKAREACRRNLSLASSRLSARS